MTKQIIVLLSTVLLASCSTVTPQSPEPAQQQLSWQARKQLLTQIQSWQLNGKIAVRTTQDSGSATINWRQRNQQYYISLLGPLGSNGMTLEGNNGKALMKTADGKSFTATSAQQLLAEQWGFNLPVSYLRYWIRGLPVPGISHKDTFDRYHRIASFTQQGYKVDYLAYNRTSKIDMPAKIAIKSPRLNTKIVIYKWQL